MRNQKKLLVNQLDKKLKPFFGIEKIPVPDRGWVHSIRTTLNMTLEQLGRKLGITKQGAKRIEESEASGGITLKLLREVGAALEMKLVYGFIPIHGSLEQLIDQKATKLAEKIVLRTNHNMMLEGQATGNESIRMSIRDLSIEIKNEMRKSLWD